METATTETRTTAMEITPSAALKIGELLEAEGNPQYFLRVAVQPGGCSGLRYSLYFDDRKLDGDLEITGEGITVRIDRMSVPYLRGGKLDWVEGLEQSGFTIDNPNARGTCACGDSFH